MPIYDLTFSPTHLKKKERGLHDYLQNNTHTTTILQIIFFLFYLLETTEKSFSLGVIIFYSSKLRFFLFLLFPSWALKRWWLGPLPSFLPHRTRKKQKEIKNNLSKSYIFSIIEKKRLMIIDRVRRRACLIPARSNITRVSS